MSSPFFWVFSWKIHVPDHHPSGPHSMFLSFEVQAWSAPLPVVLGSHHPEATPPTKFSPHPLHRPQCLPRGWLKLTPLEYKFPWFAELVVEWKLPAIVILQSLDQENVCLILSWSPPSTNTALQSSSAMLLKRGAYCEPAW